MPYFGSEAVEAHSMPNRKFPRPIFVMAGRPDRIRYTVMSSTQPTVTKPNRRKTPCTTSSIVCFFFISAVHRDSTGGGNVLGGFRAQGEVEELLCVLGELRAGLGHENERSPDDIAAVLDGILRGGYAADGQGLDVVLQRCKGSIADGVRVLGDGGDDVAGGGQLLTVLAGILGARDGLEAVAGAGTGFTTDENNSCVIAADFGPVGDLAGVDIGDLLDRQVGNGVSGFTIMAMPSSATVVSVSVAFSSSFSARLDRPMSQRPSETA